MHQPRTNLSKAFSQRRNRKTGFKLDRQRLRSPEIDAEPSNSALDALARGLITIGDRFFRGKPMLRIP
ncbi:MAG: hypothetical protein M3N43_06080 [Actinomycetota bacterium]|nr:hypothetical protein [Actinomycetota bacterium]